jgi:hypothetical protein
MKITRNQIVGAWLWLRVRPAMSLYMFRTYHQHSVFSMREAKWIAKIVGDIDAAKERTCSRDAYRCYAANILAHPETFLAGVAKGIKGTARLISDLRKGDSHIFSTHDEWARHWVPATCARFADQFAVYGKATGKAA